MTTREAKQFLVKNPDAVLKNHPEHHKWIEAVEAVESENGFPKPERLFYPERENVAARLHR